MQIQAQGNEAGGVAMFDTVAFVFDLSRRDSFQSLRVWVPDAIKRLPPRVSYSLWGNKCDLVPGLREQETRQEAIVRSFENPQSILSFYLSLLAPRGQSPDEVLGGKYC